MNKIIVIGSGILGASTAFHLAKEGAIVTLVDRKDRGQATDAAAGIVCPWLTQRRNKAWYKLVKGGARYYPELVEQLEGETGYKKVGALSLHTNKDKLAKIAERAYKRREDAPEIGEISILTPAETKGLFPPISDEYGAVHITGGARVNGRALRDALILAACKKGATVYQGDAELLLESDKVKGVQIDNEKIYADQVIITGGAWASELLKPLGIKYLVTHQRAQIIHLKLQEMDTGNWPVIMPPTNQYLLSFPGGRVVAGSTHEDDVNFDYRVTAEGIHEILDKAFHVAPGLKASTFLETRVGFRPFTPGFLPVIGKLPAADNILLANGLGASGLTSGPYLGAELAKLALGKQLEIDLELYKVETALDYL
ncbi:NAD(P)/FAD-dependent oxidoreductase [Metabacillus malikii]|uniref:D-amino-acid dehydrogenase n=1 Tax=Metabacillus malikii TaxID=1504265 RepID=A0ABT9ZIS2_9BACI|nr:FAD-dependent oxidoreductase [Metabacillus malikii]MDQ0231712.1 D-amino-acid dehydrogenase [Metabacillus malikii]